MIGCRVILAVAVVGVVTGAGYLGWHRPAGVRPVVGDAPSARALVYFEPATTDLGSQIWGHAIAFQARLHNDGANPITIDSTRQSCACTFIAE